MTHVISIRLEDKDFERLVSLGDKRENVTKGIRLLYAVKSMGVMAEDEELHEQTSLKEKESEENE